VGKQPTTWAFSFRFITFEDILQRMTNSIIRGTWADLDLESQELIKKAEDALQNAYAPYSRFRVAAAIILDNGVVITGTNQENAAYPDGMCAERVALFAKASQYPEKQIKKLVVVAQAENVTGLSPATCCGSCRQAMLEFELRQGKTFEVIMQGYNREWIKAPSAESLLPFSFSKRNLGR
jgi:cytidine deaminase